MVNTQLIKDLLTRLKEDAKAGCELKSSDFPGKDTLNVDAAHDAILYCQQHKHNDDTIFDDDYYDSSKENGNYPGTSRHKSECVSKLEENVCYIRDSFSGVALKGYNNYLDSAGTPKKEEWHKYHFGNTIKTREEIGSGFTKNKDLLKNIKNYSTYLNFDNFIHKEYQLAGDNKDISNFDQHCILGLNFTWQAVLYYGYCQFLENEKNCTFDTKVNGKKIIECLRQINFTTLEDSVPKWKIGYVEDKVREIYKAFNVDSETQSPFHKMDNNGRDNSDDQTEYYFITSQSFVHSQISKILPSTDYNSDNYKGFEARNEGDEDSSGIGEEEMRKGMEALFTNYTTMDKPAKRMLWQFLKFQGDSSHLVFYSIIKAATPQSNPISIKVLTGERPLVKRAQLERKTIVVRRFNVFNKYWPEAGSSDGTYIEFVADAEAQAKTLLAKAVSLKQSEYYENWGDNLDSEITNLKNNLGNSNKVNKLKEKMKKFGKYIIEQKIQTYIGGDFKNDAEKFFKLMRPAKDATLKPVRGAGGKQFDFGKDVDVVFSKLGFLADNYDTLDNETKKLLTIKEMMSGIKVGLRNAVDWDDHLTKIVNSFEKHEAADAVTNVNYKVLVLNSKNDLEIDIKGLTTFVSMNYYVMNDRSIFSSSSDSYQKVFFFAKILKFFIEEGIKEGKIQLPGQEEYSSGGGQQVGGNWYTRNATDEIINEKYFGHYKNPTLENMVKYLAEICRKIVELKQKNITDMDSIIQIHGNVLKPIRNGDRFVWQNGVIRRSDEAAPAPKKDQIASFQNKDISLSEDSVLIPDPLKMKWDSKKQQLIWKSEQGEDIPLKSPTPICTIVNEFSIEGSDIKEEFQKSNVVKNDKYLKTLKENYESEISGHEIKFISVKKEGPYIIWDKVEDNNDVGLGKRFVTYKQLLLDKGLVTYKQLLYEEALVRKFLDTVPSNISTNDELTTFINNNNTAHDAISANKSIEETLPNYQPDYPYTIWWLYSYINKGGGYEDFTDLFNSKITDDTNNTKYYFVNETKFMEWKEKILSHEYNACIRYKYDYFLNGGVFQDYVFTTADAADDAAAADATAANTENEFKIFTELEIKHLIVSTISLSGRFSDDNAILEDMEIVNLIQKELNKTVYGDSQGDRQEEISKKHLILDDVNENKDDNEKEEVDFVKHYTEEEVVNLKFKKAAETGKVIDLTTIDDDDPATGGGSDGRAGCGEG